MIEAPATADVDFVTENGEEPAGIVQEHTSMQKQYPIDFVYRWINPVNGESKLHQVLRSGATRTLGQMSCVERYRDNGELRFSLRSVAQHAPWVHAIHIVGEGAPPTWLRIEHPIVWVDTIMLQLSYRQIPQLNSETQKLYYSSIPNLSERFICFDDDWFFGDDVFEDDFFTGDGMPIQPSLNSGYGEHSPVAWTRALYESAMEALPREYLASIKAAGVTRPDPWVLMRGGLAGRGLVAISAERDAQIWLRNTNVLFYIDILHDIEQIKPKSYCINDDWSLQQPEHSRQMSALNRFLASMYPAASPWERG